MKQEEIQDMIDESIREHDRKEKAEELKEDRILMALIRGFSYGVLLMGAISIIVVMVIS